MTTEYRLLTYRDGLGKPRAGILVGDRVHDAAVLLSDSGIDEPGTTLGLLYQWDAVRSRLSALLPNVRDEDGVPLADVPLEAPILYPGAVFASGGNYTDHLEEMARIAGRELTKYRVDEPFFTLKTTVHSIIGDKAPIRYPKFTKKLDWEAEIGVVIGRETYEVEQDQAMEAVAGYLIINDLSARDYIRREGLPNQIIHDWFGQKSFRDSLPMGPWITPAEFIPDPHDLSLRLWVNDMLKQDGNSRNMIYPLAELVATLSRHVVLRPGDVISTACPAGAGVAQGQFLAPGDIIRIEVSRCGTLTNAVVGG